MNDVFLSIQCSKHNESWKFQIFIAFQILCEIKFNKFVVSKTANLDIFICSEFAFRTIFEFLQRWNFLKSNFRPSKMFKIWFHVKYEWRKNSEISTLWVIRLTIFKLLPFGFYVKGASNWFWTNFLAMASAMKSGFSSLSPVIGLFSGKTIFVQIGNQLLDCWHWLWGHVRNFWFFIPG